MYRSLRELCNEKHTPTSPVLSMRVSSHHITQQLPTHLLDAGHHPAEAAAQSRRWCTVQCISRIHHTLKCGTPGAGHQLEEGLQQWQGVV